MNDINDMNDTNHLSFNELEVVMSRYVSRKEEEDMAVTEFMEYVGNEELIRRLHEVVWYDKNVISNTTRKRMLRMREVLRDNGGYEIPFKLYNMGRE